MSATDWGVCPKCQRLAEEAKEKAIKTAGQSYGKVPAAEYERLLAESRQEIDLKSTLRENYEVGITHTGEFYVIYRGDCQECDFAHEFKHEKQLDISGPRRKGEDD